MSNSRSLNLGLSTEYSHEKFLLLTSAGSLKVAELGSHLQRRAPSWTPPSRSSLPASSGASGLFWQRLWSRRWRRCRDSEGGGTAQSQALWKSDEIDCDRQVGCHVIPPWDSSNGLQSKEFRVKIIETSWTIFPGPRKLVVLTWLEGIFFLVPEWGATFPSLVSVLGFVLENAGKKNKIGN